MTRQVYPFLAAAALLFLATGCLERYLTIESQPSGARVLIDGKFAGRTPILERPINHTGQHQFTLEKDGFQRHQSMEAVSGPWYCQFPLDIVTELLIPHTFKVEHKFAFKLKKAGEPNAQELAKRAEALQRKAEELPALKRDAFTGGEAAAIVVEGLAIIGVVALVVLL